MKLYIDDIRDVPDGSWTLARTITEAIRTIDNYSKEITHISLDHDISHDVEVDGVNRPFPCKENFTAVARYIGAMYSRYPRFGGFERSGKYPIITIHSANPVGAKEMMLLFRGLKIDVEINPMMACNRYETTLDN